jgi:hypothetical protein
MIDGYQIISKNTVQDTPVNGNIDVPISSNWAYDHVAAADPHTGYMLESNIGTTANKYLQLNGSAQIPAVSGALLTNINAATVGSLAASSFLRSDASDTTTGQITIDYDGSTISQLVLQGSANNNSSLTFLYPGSEAFSIGIDAFDSNKFKISDSQGLGTNDRLILDSSGNLEVTGVVTISGASATIDGNTVYHANNFGKTQIDALGINATSVTGAVYPAQGAQTAKTTSTTLTAAEINTGIITVNNGAAGTTTLTLPLATAMDSQFTGVSAGYSWDFSVVNISTTAAEDADIGTNTGWTLVGNMDIEADDDPRARSSAKFRARKTGAGAWTLYRTA